MAHISKYSGSDESEYQPGSNDLVLRNKLGITDPQEMAEAELNAFFDAELRMSRYFTADHRFTDEDILSIHREIFEELYDWAGKIRSVDLSRGGFMFARAIFVRDLLADYSANVLGQFTPAVTRDPQLISEQLAIIHAEFILIHPFRDGNGRTGRLLLGLIAQQAGFSGLDYEVFADHEKYIGGIHAAMEKNYAPLQRMIFDSLLK